MNHREFLEGKDFSIVLGVPFFQLSDDSKCGHYVGSDRNCARVAIGAYNDAHR